jgi:hypothetical protein
VVILLVVNGSLWPALSSTKTLLPLIVVTWPIAIGGEFGLFLLKTRTQTNRTASTITRHAAIIPATVPS